MAMVLSLENMNEALWYKLLTACAYMDKVHSQTFWTAAVMNCTS